MEKEYCDHINDHNINYVNVGNTEIYNFNYDEYYDFTGRTYCQGPTHVQSILVG